MFEHLAWRLEQWSHVSEASETDELVPNPKRVATSFEVKERLSSGSLDLTILICCCIIQTTVLLILVEFGRKTVIDLLAPTMRITVLPRNSTMKTIALFLLTIGAVIMAPYCIWSLQVVDTTVIQSGEKNLVATALSSQTLFLTNLGEPRFSGKRYVFRDGKVMRSGPVIFGRGHPPIQFWNDATVDEVTIFHKFFPGT